jgi:hypothetical protein
VGPAVMQLAGVEELDAHKRAVEIRMKYMDDAKVKGMDVEELQK